MANQAYRAKKKINLLLKLKETVICEIISSQEKIIRKEINHLKEICKRKKSGFDICHVKGCIAV